MIQNVLVQLAKFIIAMVGVLMLYYLYIYILLYPPAGIYFLMRGEKLAPLQRVYDFTKEATTLSQVSQHLNNNYLNGGMIRWGLMNTNTTVICMVNSADCIYIQHRDDVIESFALYPD